MRTLTAPLFGTVLALQITPEIVAGRISTKLKVKLSIDVVILPCHVRFSCYVSASLTAHFRLFTWFRNPDWDAHTRGLPFILSRFLFRVRPAGLVLTQCFTMNGIRDDVVAFLCVCALPLKRAPLEHSLPTSGIDWRTSLGGKAESQGGTSASPNVS